MRKKLTIHYNTHGKSYSLWTLYMKEDYIIDTQLKNPTMA